MIALEPMPCCGAPALDEECQLSRRHGWSLTDGRCNSCGDPDPDLCGFIIFEAFVLPLLAGVEA